MVAVVVTVETMVVEIVWVVVIGGRVLVIVVREPDMLVVTVVVLAGSVVTVVESKVTVVCERSEPVVKKKWKILQRSRVASERVIYMLLPKRNNTWISVDFV